MVILAILAATVFIEALVLAYLVKTSRETKAEVRTLRADAIRMGSRVGNLATFAEHQDKFLQALTRKVGRRRPKTELTIQGAPLSKDGKVVGIMLSGPAPGAVNKIGPN